MDTKPIKVKHRDGTTSDGVLQVSTGAPWRMELSGIDSETFCVHGEDLFEALSALRKQLEQPWQAPAVWMLRTASFVKTFTPSTVCRLT